MSEQQKQNLIVFVVLNVIVAYVVYSQLLEKQFSQQTVLNRQLGEFGDKVDANENMRIKVANVQSRYREAKQTLDLLMKSFPRGEGQKSEMGLELASLPEEVPGLEIRRSPQLEEDADVFGVPGIKTEDLQQTYKSLLLKNMSVKTYPGRTVIPNRIQVTTYQQELLLAAPYSAMINFLERLSSLKFFYVVTKLELYENSNTKDEQAMLADLEITIPSPGDFE